MPFSPIPVASISLHFPIKFHNNLPKQPVYFLLTQHFLPHINKHKSISLLSNVELCFVFPVAFPHQALKTVTVHGQLKIAFGHRKARLYRHIFQKQNLGINQNQRKSLHSAPTLKKLLYDFVSLEFFDLRKMFAHGFVPSAEINAVKVRK